jgi:PBP1b-binding outer membrane lipoprotein LpoB
MINPRSKVLMMALVGSLALAGCLGGGGVDEVVPAPADPLAAVPDSALQTVAGTVDYLQLLNSLPSETREAIDVSNVVLPTSEIDEPVALN